VLFTGSGNEPLVAHASVPEPAPSTLLMAATALLTVARPRRRQEMQSDRR